MVEVGHIVVEVSTVVEISTEVEVSTVVEVSTEVEDRPCFVAGLHHKVKLSVTGTALVAETGFAFRLDCLNFLRIQAHVSDLNCFRIFHRNAPQSKIHILCTVVTVIAFKFY